MLFCAEFVWCEQFSLVLFFYLNVICNDFYDTVILEGNIEGAKDWKTGKNRQDSCHIHSMKLKDKNAVASTVA